MLRTPFRTLVQPLGLIAALACSASLPVKAQDDPGRSPVFDCQGAPEPVERIKACTDYINQHPPGGEINAALINRASAYIAIGSIDQAIADLDQIIRYDRKNADALYNRGVLYGNRGDYDRAIQDLSAAIAVKPKYANAFMNRGNAYRNKQDLDRAMQDYNQAVLLDPKLEDAYFDRGGAYYQKNDLDHAIDDFSQAIKRNPRDAGAFDNRGAVYAQKGDLDHAIQDYTQAVRLNANNGNAFLNLGNAYYGKQDYANAVKDFSEAIRLNVSSPEIFYDRGNAYDNLDQPARAIQDYSQALSLNPSYEDALKARAFDQFAARDFEKAADDFDQLARLKQQSAAYRVWLYVAEERSGTDGKAELAAAVSDANFEFWPGVVGQMMLDKADTAAVLDVVDKAAPADRQSEVCEAYFFVAQYDIIHKATPATLQKDLQTAEQTCSLRGTFRKSVEADLARLGSK